MNFVTDKLLQLVSIEGFAERLLTYEGSVEERLSPINKPREYITFEEAVQPLDISGRRFVVSIDCRFSFKNKAALLVEN
jgi:hypothetical protein